MDSLIQAIEKIGNTQVLCVGDSMLDRFVYGAAQRISPEAPIPVLRVASSSEMPGGASNVARNIISLKASCTLLTVIGDDAVGAELEALLQGVPGLTFCGVCEPGRQTTLKTRFVASGQQMLRVDREVDRAIAAAVEDELIARGTEFMEHADVLVLSDYGKGVLTPRVAQALIDAARRAGVPVVVDPKGRDYSKYAGATLISPNLKELHDVTGLQGSSDEMVESAATALLGQVSVQAVLVTRSEQGMSYVARDRRAVHLPTAAREVFDVSGAGDTVIATLAVALGTGIDPVVSARLANLAGGIVVGKVGTAAVRRAELSESARHQQHGPVTDKISDITEISALAAHWRGAGHRVGFTNGCFDLIHPGHISLLAQAAAKCDRLIVGLNTDASIRRLKGPARPIQDERSRALVLTALRFVDTVVLFDDDTPERLIKRVRPDLLVKGADYKEGDVVGWDFVSSYGGRLHLAELTPNQSTTRMVEKMT